MIICKSKKNEKRSLFHPSHGTKESFRGTTHINCNLARPLLRGFSRELKLPRIGAILRLPPCDLQFSFFAAVTLRLRPVLLRKLPARIPLLPRLGLPSVLPAALGCFSPGCSMPPSHHRRFSVMCQTRDTSPVHAFDVCFVSL